MIPESEMHSESTPTETASTAAEQHEQASSTAERPGEPETLTNGAAQASEAVISSSEKSESHRSATETEVQKDERQEAQAPREQAPKDQAPKADDGFDWAREAMKKRENLNARVLKWERNGLAVELENGTKGFMPNDMIDRDPNRNIGNYFGKTLPVRVTAVKPNSTKAAVVVSHRAILDEEIRKQGKAAIAELNVGHVVEGAVKSFNSAGAVIDLGAGIDAMVKNRDISWEYFDHPYEVLKRGAVVKAKILNIDKGRRKVQLGIKQLTEDPRKVKYKQFEEGATVTAKVTETNPHGAEVSFGDVKGFVPISEMDWKRIDKVEDVMNVGDELALKILEVDSKKHRIVLSRRQTIDNPMLKIEETFKPNSDHNGTITEVNRGGVVVQLEHGAEGFIPRSELSHDRIPKLEDVYKAGKPLENLRVISYDRRSGKITMSLIAAEREAQTKSMKNYKATSSASSFTIGDLAQLKAKLENLEKGESKQ